MNVVFEGGGIKGLTYVGALRYLEYRGVQIKKVAGTSVGALIGSLVIAGYNSGDLEQIISKMDANYFWPKSKNKVTTTVDVIKNKSLYSIHPIEALLRDLLKRGGIETFRDLKIGNNYKLKIVVTSLDLKKMLVLPEGIRELGLDPDSLDVASAVCMSASIPLVYPPYVYKGYRFVDGGLLDNFPVWVFDEEVIGFRVSKTTGFTGSVKKVFEPKKRKQSKAQIIMIDTTGYRATDFKKGLSEKYILFNRGFYYTKLFFDSHRCFL